MTLRALWTFDHVANAGAVIPVTTVAAYAANNAYNQLTGNPGTPILRAGSASASINQSTNATQPGYLVFNNGSATAQGLAIALTDIPLLQGGVTQAYFGFRTSSSTAPSSNAGGIVVGVASSVTSVPTALLTEAQLNRTINVAQFVEVFVDISAKTYSVWVDGLQVLNAQALPATWSYIVFQNVTTASASTLGYRDFYFLDVDATAPFKRLGPIQSSVASLTAVTAPNYTSSDSKTALQDLTTAYSGAPTQLPNITNAPTNDPITVTFSANAPAGSTVIAAQYKLAASVVSASKMAVTLNNGTNTKVPPAYQFPDTSAGYGRDLAGIQLVDPSGNAWTPSGFAATQLILQPQSLT